MRGGEFGGCSESRAPQAPARVDDLQSKTTMVHQPISKSQENPSKTLITSNTLILICAIVILIAILVALELRIRRSMVHSPTWAGAVDWSGIPRETEKPKYVALAPQCNLSEAKLPHEANELSKGQVN